MFDMEIERQIEEKINDFLDWINHPIVQNYYIKNSQNWDGLCASLRLIIDLQRPKKVYFSLISINSLEVIGIMQTLYMEQDCIHTLKNSIKECNNKFDLEKYDNVRDIRNKVFGHPSDKKKANNIKTRHFFDIVDEKKQLLNHTFWGTENGIERTNLSIRDLVIENSINTLYYLGEIELVFKNKIEEIMSTYKIQLESLFKMSDYYFDKLLTKENDSIVIDLFKSVFDDIAKAKEGLNERNIYEQFERQIEVIEFLCNELIPLFNKKTFKDIEFYTYASTLKDNITKLKAELKKADTVFN